MGGPGSPGFPVKMFSPGIHFARVWPGRLRSATRWRYTWHERGIFRAFSIRLSISTAWSLLLSAFGVQFHPGSINADNGENLTTPPEPNYNLIFVDLNTSIVGNSGILGGNITYRTNLTYYGNPKITYNISTLGTTGRVAFVPYAWVNYTTGGGSYFDRTIGWTSRVSDGGSWIVNMTPITSYCIPGGTGARSPGYPPGRVLFFSLNNLLS
jgi:hypothetical protein